MEQMRRILSIDGGGIKGVLPAAFLATVEDITGKRIVDYFDLIAGTSTGGIIALGLGLGLTAREILTFYEKEGPKIFLQPDHDAENGISFWQRIKKICRQKTRSARGLLFCKYDHQTLLEAVEKVFDQRTLAESCTRLIIPAFDRQRREVHVFKTAHHPRFVLDWRERVVDVAMATAAAPTYLPSYSLESGISLVDGGIWANNPVGIAAVEAVGVLGWPQDRISILSIGCSEELIDIPARAGKLGLAKNVADIFLMGQSRSATGIAKILTGHAENNRRLYRFQHSVRDGEFDLDSTSRISALKGLGSAIAREAVSEIEGVFLGERRSDFVPYYGKAGGI